MDANLEEKIEDLVKGIIINISTTVLIVFSGLLYLRYKGPQIRIHKYIALYTAKDKIEYQFKIVNKSRLQEAKNISVRLRCATLKQWANNVFMPSYDDDIKLNNDKRLVKLDRYKKYSFIKCVKKNDYYYGASYLILTYEDLEKKLKEEYSQLQINITYTNTNNKEATIRQNFTIEDIKEGHHTNDDNIGNLPIKEPAKLYYIAYGSNLNRQQMKDRCPDSKEIGSTILRGYELLFRNYRDCEEGYLTVVKNKKSKVPVGIYEISENDENKLDFYEGVNTHDYKKERISIKLKDKYIVGLIYTMVAEGKCKPTNKYYKNVKKGYDEWKFDISTLKRACVECGYLEEAI
jgi:gamma-glutamylcyclotransferase (GGCT)/AIG2-like uncharacterized protein YtfP